MRHTHKTHAPHKMHAHEVHAHEMHAHEMHTHEMYDHEMHAYKVDAHEIHTCEMHAYEVYAHGVHAHDGFLRGPSASEHRRTSIPAPARFSASSHIGFYVVAYGFQSSS